MFRAIVLTISLSLLFINRGVGALNIPQQNCVHSCPKVDSKNNPLVFALTNEYGGPTCEYHNPNGRHPLGCAYARSGGLYHSTPYSPSCPNVAVTTCHVVR